MARPGLATIKTLFALSCNRCAFPGCDHRLTDPAWNGVRADIAHIRGEKPGAARYAPDMTDDERNSVDNLMILCPNHHREIDQLRPQDWPPDRLMQAKVEHEADCRKVQWATDAQLEFFSSLLACASVDPREALSLQERPRVYAELVKGETVYVVNSGDLDAYDLQVTMPPAGGPGGRLILEETRLPRLSPGGRWRVGILTTSFGDTGVVQLRVTWRNSDEDPFEGDFPL